MLTQAPQGSQLRSAIDDARRQMKKLGLGLRSSQRRSLAVNAPRPSDVPAVKGFKLWQTGDGEIKLEWRRQEDEADMCRFLETALQESMKVIEQKQEPEQEEQEQEDKQEDVQLAAEDGVELQEEEGVLQPETDGPAKSVYTLVADADQSRVPKTGDAPESTGSQTELAPDGSSDVEGPSTPKPPKDAKSFSGLQKPLDLKDPELKFAVSLGNLGCATCADRAIRLSNEQCN